MEEEKKLPRENTTTVDISDDSIELLSDMNMIGFDKLSKSMTTDFLWLRNTISILVGYRLASLVHLQEQMNEIMRSGLENIVRSQEAQQEFTGEKAQRETTKESLGLGPDGKPKQEKTKPQKKKEEGILGRFLSSLRSFIPGGTTLLAGGLGIGALTIMTQFPDMIKKFMIDPIADLIDGENQTLLGKGFGMVKNIFSWIGETFSPTAAWIVALLAARAALSPLRTFRLSVSAFKMLRLLPGFISGIGIAAAGLVGLYETIEYLKNMNIEAERKKLQTQQKELQSPSITPERKREVLTNIRNQVNRWEQMGVESNSPTMQMALGILKNHQEFLAQQRKEEIQKGNPSTISSSVKRELESKQFKNMTREKQTSTINEIIKSTQKSLSNLPSDKQIEIMEMVVQSILQYVYKNAGKNIQLQLDLQKMIQEKNYQTKTILETPTTSQNMSQKMNSNKQQISLVRQEQEKSLEKQAKINSTAFTNIQKGGNKTNNVSYNTQNNWTINGGALGTIV